MRELFQNFIFLIIAVFVSQVLMKNIYIVREDISTLNIS